MSCGPCDKKKKQRRGMTRGEFIGSAAGAVAGASLAAGGRLGAEEIQEGCRRPSAMECGPNALSLWEMPASILQIIWAEIFPRFVAYRWWKGSYPQEFEVGRELHVPPPSTPGAPPRLKTAINDFLEKTAQAMWEAGTPWSTCTPASVDSAGNPVEPWTCDLLGYPGCLTHFEAALRRVVEYLEADPGGVMPIRFMAEGGFDFILSDAGLDLFAPGLHLPPDAPDWNSGSYDDERAELLRYYMFRRTGRGTIGIPSYLDGAEALALDVQSPVGPSQVTTPLSEFNNIAINAAGCTPNELECLTLDISQSAREGFAVYTTSSFFAAAEKVRCWQLEGAVYRGVLTELPRIVATMWKAAVDECPPSPTSYATRFNDSDLMREIFKERLETSLPGPSRMLFETRSELSDVIISNQGLLFPVAGEAPDLVTMLGSMVMGRAGNPVFTDSRRPLRGP